MNFGLRYINATTAFEAGTLHGDRFNTPDAAEARRMRMFIPGNWEVVKIETKQVITVMVPKTTAVEWVEA